MNGSICCLANVTPIIQVRPQIQKGYTAAFGSCNCVRACAYMLASKDLYSIRFYG